MCYSYGSPNQAKEHIMSIQYPTFDFSVFSREEREAYADVMEFWADGSSPDEGGEEYAAQAWLARCQP